MITTDRYSAVVGMGATGLSVARHLARAGERFVVLDTREQPPQQALFEEEFPGLACYTGGLNAEVLASAARIVLSPGVALANSAIAEALNGGVPVCGDVDLFCEAVAAPVIAITGSNAKSSVTTLVGDILLAAGHKVQVGGNLGKPMLDMLAEAEADYYVLELSSFQLETTHKLRAQVATVLNVSADHLDRYPNFMAYQQAKQRIYRNAANAVFNRRDPLTQPLLASSTKAWSFGLDKPDLNDWGLQEVDAENWLCHGAVALCPVKDLPLAGMHNVENALAAAAIAHAAGVSKDSIVSALKQFRGLPHRCQWVANKSSVDYFDDSKGTNIGATVAAIRGLKANVEHLLLIAGGQGKGADFKELGDVIAECVDAVILIGEDAGQIEAAIAGRVKVLRADAMTSAVSTAASLAKQDGAVLLSPACASFDMFANYEERGQAFVEAVEQLP